MANDTEYQAEALTICQEFEAADWEALLIGESEYETQRSLSSGFFLSNPNLL